MIKDSALTKIEKNDKTIHSKRGLGFIFALLFPPFALFGIYRVLQEIALGNRKLSLLMILALSFLIYAMASVFRSAFDKVAVNLEGVSISNPKRTHFYRWNEIELIMVTTDFFGSYGVTIHLNTNLAPHHFSSSLFQNGNEIIKSMLEAAHFGNPTIQVKGLHHFEPPPYNIFGSRSCSGNDLEL